MDLVLPTSVEPLWGIIFEAERPDARARLITDRALASEARGRGHAARPLILAAAPG